MTTWGVALGAPIGHYYYAHFLTQSFNYPGTKGILAKLIFDQTVFAPVISLIFLNYMALVNGEDMVKSFKESLKQLPSLMIANWKLWPLATLIQLMFFGVHTATIFNLLVGFFWGIYLCIRENYNKKDTPEVDKEEKV